MMVRQAAAPPIIGHIVLTLLVHKEGEQFVSECPELGTASCGDTIDEAFHNIREATELYLNAIEEAGERERIFRKRRVPVHDGPPHDADTHVTVSTADTVSFLVRGVRAITERHGSPAAVL